MSWLTNILTKNKTPNPKKGVPEGLWCKCDACEEFLYQSDLAKHLYVCPKCQHHHYISARERLTHFFDADSELVEVAGDALAQDPLTFKDTKKYKDRLQAAIKKTGETEAFVALYGELFGHKAVAGAFEFAFIGGSMSSAVGERFVQAAEKAMAENCPFICFCTSGGARMQEGMFSLLQMAKTSAVIAQLQQRKLPYITVLTHPTMGGVSASLASLGDVILAEPKALIGFSGPRVIEQTIKQKLPKGFQRSEFLLEHGAIDAIINRQDLRKVIGSIIAKLQHNPPID